MSWPLKLRLSTCFPPKGTRSYRQYLFGLGYLFDRKRGWVGVQWHSVVMTQKTCSTAFKHVHLLLSLSLQSKPFFINVNIFLCRWLVFTVIKMLPLLYNTWIQSKSFVLYLILYTNLIWTVSLKCYTKTSKVYLKISI